MEARMFRATTMLAIMRSIEASAFSVDDFKISNYFANDAEFSIHLLIDESIHFAIVNSTGSKITVRKSPGSHTKVEILGSTVDNVHILVALWLKDAYDELLATPHGNDNFARMREELQESINEATKDYGDEHFSASEIQKLKDKLEKLESDIQDIARRLQLSEDYAKNVQDDIRVMQETLPKLKKSSWAKFAANKLIGWAKYAINSEEVGKAIGAAVREVLRL